MKVRQRSVRVIELVTNNYDKMVNFINRRFSSLTNRILIVNTDNDEIKSYLLKQKLNVLFLKNDFQDSNNDEISIEETTKNTTFTPPVVKNNEKISQNSTKTEIFGKIVRSGEEIKSDNKLIFLNKINAGAKIYSSKEIEIFDEVFGKVSCDGEYMIVKKSKKGTIIFNNEEIEDIKRLSFISKDGIKEIE